MRKKELLELENDIIFFNNLIDRYSLDTFNVNKTECDFLEKLVLENCKKLNSYPTIIILRGFPCSGKSSFISSLFSDKGIKISFKKNIVLTELLDVMPKYVLDMGVNLCVWEHVDWSTKSDVSGYKILSDSMMGVHIFECDDNEFIPQVFKDAAFYEMNFRGHKVIEDISTVFLDLIDQEANKQNFVLSDQEKKWLLDRTLKKKGSFVSLVENIVGNYCRLKSKFPEMDIIKNVTSPQPITSSTRIFDVEEFNLKYQSFDKPRIKSIFDRLNYVPVYLKATLELIDKVKELVEAHPNIVSGKKELFAAISNAFYLSNKNKLKLPNIILIGNTSCGKTCFAKKLSSLLGQKREIIVSIGTGSNITSLLGTTADYKDASEGKILMSFSDSMNGKGVLGNPVVILDEIDKGCFSGSKDTNANMSGVLCELLEECSSKYLLDNYFDVHFKGDEINYIATANDESLIPDYIMSRFPVVIRVRDYTKEEMIDVVIPEIYKNFISTYDAEKIPIELSYDICNDVFEFCDNNPRRIMTVLSVIAAETRTNKGFHNFVLNKRQKKELKEQFYSANQLSTIGFVK